MKNKRALFLHMGPGFNAFVERQIFENEQDTEFWDQPFITSDDNGFSELIDATQNKIESMFENLGEPIDLICHSFGGLLATEVLKKCSDKISSCTLISTGFYFRKNFLNLLQALLADRETNEELKEEINQCLSCLSNDISNDEFWETFSLVLKAPHFPRLYWSTTESFQSYLELAGKAPALDQSTFTNVAMEVIKMQMTPNRSPYLGPVRVILGSDDPLLNIDEEIKAWKLIFPQAQIEVIQELRHFVHIEKRQLFAP